jgi:ankyrin repeat protein
MPSKTKARNKNRAAPSATAAMEGNAVGSTDICCAEELSENSLLFAVAEQNLEKVIDCLSKGHDVQDTPLQGCTPLLLAVKLGNPEIVKVFISHGATCCTPDEKGTTMLHHAAVNGFSEIAHCLVTDGNAKMDQRNQAGCSPLYQAVQHGHTKCVLTFLELQADIEARTRTGATPLYIASDRGNAELVELLLDAGGEANAKTDLEMTPLLVASFNGHREVASTLLSRGVDIEQRGPCGGTALYVAAQEGRRGVAEFLIEQGAKVDAGCEGDLTPSLIAAMQGHTELVQVLLDAQGDVNVRTGKGSTLAIMAARHVRTGVLRALVDLEGPTALDGQNTEGLSAMGASRLGRHADTTAYIESVIAAKKEADLKAWEARMPGLLEELDPPCKKKNKGKSKNKAKKNKKCVTQCTQAVTEDLDNTRDQVPDAQQIAEAMSIPANNLTEEPLPLLEASANDAEASGSPWTQVRRKGLVKPLLAIAPPESPALVPQTRPTSTVSPLGTQPGPVPVTPLSTQSSTPCGGTNSPFGFCTVLPPWPSTPEMWPQLEDGVGATFWSSLPPAMSIDPIDFLTPQKDQANIYYSNSSSNSALTLTKHCQPVFAAPWFVPRLMD